MSVRHALLQRLTDSPNLAVERAVEAALAACAPAEQRDLAEVLLTRNRRSGWVALIRAFDRLDESIQQKLLARPRDLFGPLAETMQDVDGPARANVIAIVQRCADARLVYLLAESLMDNRPEVRDLAGRSLLDTVRRCCDRAGAAAPDQAVDADAAGQIRRAVDFAVRQFKTHRQQAAVLAALIHERQTDATLWLLFQDTYDDLTRAATAILRAPADPALAPAVLLALASPLKPAAMAGLAAVESPAVAAAVAGQSFRLLDPAVRDAAGAIAHLKLLPALRKEPLWARGGAGAGWADWLRLITTVGLQPAEKLNWLTRLLADAPPGPEGTAWKTCVLRAIADTGQAEAGTSLANALRDADERVARCAARFLLHRRIPEWREVAAATLPRSPHLSVRRLAVAYSRFSPDPPAPAAGTRAAPSAPLTAAPRGFEKTWADYQKLPPVMQHSAARAVATDPAYAERLREKLQSGSPQDLAQGLRMLVALPNLTAYRSQVIALCGHADPRIAGMAVRLVGRLEDPRLKDLLEAAMRHADTRVRANAVESMEELHVADRSQQVLTMLNSRHNRERANAIKAIGQFNFATARECLLRMLADANPLHRVSALWVVGQLDLLEIMRQVSAIARRDPNLRVRKRAADMLETLSGNVPTAP
jgi:HEAT repeat protein